MAEAVSLLLVSLNKFHCFLQLSSEPLEVLFENYDLVTLIAPGVFGLLALNECQVDISPPVFFNIKKIASSIIRKLS